MTNYYFKAENEVAYGYIRQCVIDAFRSEDIEPDKNDLNVFDINPHNFSEDGFIEVTIDDMPVERIATKINYRLHRNGMKYGIYKKYVRKDGVERLHPIKDIRAVIGKKVDQETVSDEQGLVKITAENVRNIFLCDHPEGEIFLSKDNKYVINTASEESDDFVVYENRKRFGKDKS